MTHKEQAFAYAIDHTQKVHITYVDKFNERTSRTICPKKMYMRNNKWLCSAWCESVQDWRTFKMGGVLKYSIREERFDPWDFHN